MKMSDLSLKSGNVDNYVGEDKKNFGSLQIQNYYGAIVSQVFPNPVTSNPNIMLYITFVGNSELKVGNTRGTLISAGTYQANMTLDGKPTKEQFLSFYERCYYVTVLISRGIYAGDYNLFIDVNCQDVFAASNLELEGILQSNYGNGNYKISLTPAYSFFSYLTDQNQISNVGLLHEAVSSTKKGSYTHYLYVNGGIFGKSNNYTVTEVIESSEENPIRWVNNERSKLFCYKYDVAKDPSDVWDISLNAPKLDTNRDAAFSSIMSGCSVSSVEQNVAFLNKQTPFFSYDLIPTFLRNGSQFTGNRFTMEFPATLPNSADLVNNSWANVKQIGEDTDANNTVIVLYGEPSKEQIDDEKPSLTDDSTNSGENSDSSESKKPSSTDLIYGDDGGSASVLTKLYAISDTQLDLLGQNLWSQKYFDVLRIQDNPIENIISIKRFPFTITGESESITVGNVDLGVNADRIKKGVHHINFGEVKIGGKYGNFLDIEPFTNLKICLPYIGFYDLPLSELINQMLSVEYIVDLIHGDCTALIKRNGYAFLEFNGNMGVNVPITQTDRVSAETKHIQNIVGGAISGFSTSGLAGGLVGLGTSMIESGLNTYNSSHTASGSGAVNLAAIQNVRLIYSRPSTILKKDNGYVPYPTNYRHTHGLPYNNSIKISELNGFFKCGNNIDLSTIPTTKEIKDMIINLLQGGVYK